MKIDYTFRTEMSHCMSDTEFLAKLHCIRLGLEVRPLLNMLAPLMKAQQFICNDCSSVLLYVQVHVNIKLK